MTGRLVASHTHSAGCLRTRPPEQTRDNANPFFLSFGQGKQSLRHLFMLTSPIVTRKIIINKTSRQRRQTIQTSRLCARSQGNMAGSSQAWPLEIVSSQNFPRRAWVRRCTSLLKTAPRRPAAGRMQGNVEDFSQCSRRARTASPAARPLRTSTMPALLPERAHGTPRAELALAHRRHSACGLARERGLLNRAERVAGWKKNSKGSLAGGASPPPPSQATALNGRRPSSSTSGTRQARVFHCGHPNTASIRPLQALTCPRARKISARAGQILTTSPLPSPLPAGDTLNPARPQRQTSDRDGRKIRNPSTLHQPPPFPSPCTPSFISCRLALRPGASV